MSRDDDRDEAGETSTNYFKSADQRKQENKEDNARGQGKLLDLRRAVLRTQVKPIKQEKGEEPTPTKKEVQAREEAEKKEGTLPMTTKTRLQEQKAAIQTAQDKPDTASTIRKQEEQEEVKKQSSQEYQQNMS